MGNTYSGKYLTFTLGQEEYGLAILQVREIIGYMAVTEIPQTAYEMKGVLNLRGQVIPVVDLRLKFGMPEADVTDTTCIIVVEALKKGAKKQIGIIVDSVSEVVDIAEEAIEPPPEFGSSVDCSLIMAMAKMDSRIIVLLNIDMVLFQDAFDALDTQMT